MEEAIVLYERALEQVPTLLETHTNLAAAWYQLAMQRAAGPLPGWLEEAAKHYRYVLGIAPDHVPAALGLAACQHALGQAEESLRLLQSLARAHPTHRDVNYNLAVAYLAAGDKRRAREAAETELRHHPDHALAGELAERLR